MASTRGFLKNVLYSPSLFPFFLYLFSFVRRVIGLPRMIDALIIMLSSNYQSKPFPTISFRDIPKVSERKREMDKSPLSSIQTRPRKGSLCQLLLLSTGVHAEEFKRNCKKSNPQTKRQRGISHLKTRFITRPFTRLQQRGLAEEGVAP